MTDHIPFNRPFMTEQELANIGQAHANGHLSGDGPFTRRCSEWLTARLGCHRTLLTHSCTAALEMAALLLDLQKGDEVIMPSFTFVSTANAFALRGAVPVFIDIRGDTLNIDETLIEQAITDRTRAIVPVHYAGVSCEMDTILSIARAKGIYVVEDAAHGILACYRGSPLGSLGDVGALSFHETKNIISGEGGALTVNRPDLCMTAEIIREKGTNRSQFIRGEVEKYTWQQLGSSYLPGEITAAFLSAQLDQADWITEKRLEAWDCYHTMLAPLEAEGLLRRPIVPVECSHNAHMYYVILSGDVSRQDVLERLAQNGINAVSHYVPLHTSPAAQRYSRAGCDLRLTETLSSKLLRLPLWIGIGEAQIEHVVGKLQKAITL